MTPPPGVLDEIKALFSWNPPRLNHGDSTRSSTASTTTRPPAFYDKHFSSKLVLKRVEWLPSLVQDLAKNVDKSLSAALTTLPPLDGFITSKARAIQIRLLDPEVTGERGVANFYHMTTGIYCSQVASTLALHPSASFSQWLGLLSWTPLGPSSSYAIKDGLAIMDGLLRFRRIDRTDETRVAIMESMESKYRHIVEKMGESRESLATWEIKSISTGTAEVMNAVLILGKFSWTFCTAHNCHFDPKHQKAKQDIERVAIGPDAQAPPWSFLVDSLNTYLVAEHPDEEIDIQPLTPRVDAPSAPIQRLVARRVTRSAVSASTSPPQPSALVHTRKRQVTARSPALQARRSPTKVIGKKRKRDEADEAYYSQTAQSLVREAWAQAVRVDGTLIVLHSGNHELVCVRHRGSQTLYVSDVIEPPTCVDPGYGKLHVGIYIAAVQDTMDRWEQNLKTPGDGGDLIGDDKDQDDQGHNRDSGSGHGVRDGHRVGMRKSEFQHSAGRKGLSDDEPVAIEERWHKLCQPSDEHDQLQKTIHMANKRDVVLLYLQYDVYDSLIPASFLRSAPSIMSHTSCPTPPFSPRAISTYALEECLTIVLTSEIGRGATGVAHRGTLKPAISDSITPLDVVVKLAFDNEQRDALKSEYEIYRRLRSKGVLGGIATVLGLFDDSEGGARALVMLYAGVPLVTELQDFLSVSDRKSALSTLQCIHRAGILHGDIRRDNILMGDSGVTIIDFGHSEECDNQRAKDKEFARLRYFLSLAREKVTSECGGPKCLT